MLLVRIGHLDSGSIKDQKIPKDMIHLLIKIGSVAIAVFLCTYCLKIATRKAMLYHNTARYLGRKRGHLSHAGCIPIEPQIPSFTLLKYNSQ